MRRRIVGACSGLLVLLAGEAASQETPAASVRKEVRAARVQGRAPQVDGRLIEEEWQSAPALKDFVQREPDEGRAATEETEIRFLYGPDALYVGARMYSLDPRKIQAPVSRRDNGLQAERLLVSLDTYLDRRTAYTFGVTASGVRLDHYHADDSESTVDASFDPVWEARTHIDSLGWTAEMRIPYSQLRFNSRPEQVWGVNATRVVPSRDETSFWVLVPTRATGWASRFGDLAGIEGIRPTRRIEVLPYIANGVVLTGEPGAGNPFDDGSTVTTRVGGDLKMGLGPNLTLEGTVNPDFGQVEADPAEVNLSAYETFFEEKRPFFVEGSQLLEGIGPTYFYSRRIGGVPDVGTLVNGFDFVDHPQTSTILGAAKLTGRLPGGTSVGAMAAMTGQEVARTFQVETDSLAKVRLVPATQFAVARVQQEFGPSASTAGLMLSGLRRDVSPGEPLSALLTRDALSGGADLNLRFRGGQYVLSGHLGFSHVAGDSLAILRLQRSSVRYFQRPDADYVEVDPSRTSLTGVTGGLDVARRSGSHWLWSGGVRVDSPELELNDVGYLETSDDISGYASLRYRETRPRGVFRNYSVALLADNWWNSGGVHTLNSLALSSIATWKNFWGTRVDFTMRLPAQADHLTRGGPLMGTGYEWTSVLDVFNRTSSPTRWRGRIYYGGSEQGEQTYRLYGSIAMRPGPNWEMSVAPNYLRSTTPRQYVGSRADGPAETFGRRYIFSFIERSTLVAQFRLNYTFTPDLSLEGYAEPFAASGSYYDFGELPAAGSRDLRFYGTDGTSIRQAENRSYVVTAGDGEFALPFRDFNVRSLRTNAVLRWEWRPGSTLFLVWQQNRYASELQGALVGPGSLWETIDATGDNLLAVRLTYWFPLK